MKRILLYIIWALAAVANAQTDSINGTRYRSINLDPLYSIQLTNARGLKFSLLSNTVEGTMTGAQISGISNLNSSLQGVQVSAFSNVSLRSTGVQLSGVSSIAFDASGVQISAANICSDNMKGMQMGIRNYADTLKGLQIGLFNANICSPKGLQVGMFNYSRDSLARHGVGLMTVRPSTKLRLLGYGGSSVYANMALEVRNQSNYSILGMGFLNRGFSHFSGTFFYRQGYSFNIGNSPLSLGADLGYSHIEAFENDDDDEPNRLYSLQPRLTANCRFTKLLSLYASGGYEFIRFYRGGEYRNGWVGELGIACDLPRSHSRQKFSLLPDNYQNVGSDPANSPYGKKYPWLTVSEVVAINAFVHSFDRWVLNEDFAQTTWKSMGDNFTNGFVWDNDAFKTNQFMHPYHGNLYFTAARSNGMNFWQSYPFALGGSLMWEFIGENTPPSVNDVFSTSFGGAAIGESLYRISALILDDSSVGTERFFREFTGFVLCPMRGLNRIIHGDAFTVKEEGARYHDFERIPVHFAASTGARYLADNGTLFRGDMGQYLNLKLDYGDAMSDENNPYDYFTIEGTLNFWSKQPLFSDLHLLGRLWGYDMMEREKMGIKLGLFQHFNYYSSTSVIENDQHSPFIADDVTEGNAPFRISETAAVGPGVILRFNNVDNISLFEQRIFLNGILMGGSQSDYFRILWRDYNLGSGYSAKVNTILQFANYGRVDLKTEFYHLFTWKGYDDDAIKLMDTYQKKTDLEYINAQGDQSNTMMLVVSPRMQFYLTKHLMIDFYPSFYYRHSKYRYFDNVIRKTFEIRTGITYAL